MRKMVAVIRDRSSDISSGRASVIFKGKDLYILS